MISPASEDYLKTIYKLRNSKERVTTSAIAGKLTVSDATVTSMIKRLAKEKYLKHISYHGVVLTDKGERIAIGVIRKHRLLELFLKEVLGLEWDKVHVEAERLEHVISDEILERIDRVLGYPKIDPHGDPIPTEEGKIENVRRCQCLADVEVGETVVICRVSDDDPIKLRFMAELDLFPTVKLDVTDKSQFEGDISIRVGSFYHCLPRDVARSIYVTQSVNHKP
jgi:DtxR family transcriptional regulator, Mn-dependent transcriptional regulator